MIDASMLGHNNGADPVLTIRVSGGSDIFRFAVNMLDDQVEFFEVGRGVLVEQRERVGAKAFDEWAKSALGPERFRRLLPYFRRDAFCNSCDGRVRSGAGQKLPLGRVACRACVAILREEAP